MRIAIGSGEEVSESAALSVASVLRDKPDAVLGLDFDPALKPFCAKLAALCAAGECSLENAGIFSTAALTGPGRDSIRTLLRNSLLGPCGVKEENVFSPCACGDAGEEEIGEYDAEIAKAGGLDALVLGIGINGRIGFNEPATPFDSYTHGQKLTDATREELAPVLAPAEVPEAGVTMGIKTMMAAKKILLIACGEEKAGIIHQMVYGKTVTFVPASMLQLHLDMTLYLDGPAASKLG
ncbi:MAG: 6-phosphogluconolactonase [Oscillospiraceae bacterium]|nr:6-phosphogluconolactonase [Oscillospiraceae bacterium]